MPTRAETIAQIESVIRSDPAGRGLCPRTERGFLGFGELASAAESLAHPNLAHPNPTAYADGSPCPHPSPGRFVVIVTGFFVPEARPPAAETDGPPGAIALATLLGELGIASVILTDHFCAQAVRCGMDAAGLASGQLRVVHHAEELAALPQEWERSPSHLIAVERLGRSYDDVTLSDRWGAAAGVEFRRRVPQHLWRRQLNMRGRPIDESSVDFSPLFEPLFAKWDSSRCSIGIGDGGNEIGMGKFPWGDLVERLGASHPLAMLSAVPCRHTIVAGTSNWGAIGLAAAVAVARGQPAAFRTITPASQQTIIDAMVTRGPAVDGLKRTFTATVDGISSEDYYEPIRRIERILAEG